MPVLPPLPDIFGNYTIRGITEVVGPQPISWLPSAPGWRFLAVGMLILVVWRAYRSWQSWFRNRYRGAAVRKLDQIIKAHPNDLDSLQPVASLLKSTALRRYPRREIAALSGASWLHWLEKHGNGANFSDSSANLLGSSVYKPATAAENDNMRVLFTEVRSWIKSHSDPDSA